jgi:short-subunit dehydrogenase
MHWLLWMPSQPHLEETFLHGKTILVTGASYGIGEACALLLARAGANVLLLARTKEKLETLQTTIRATGGQASAYPMDLSQLETLPERLNQILLEHKKIDVIICNAARSLRRNSDERLYSDLEKLLRLNFSSHALLVSHLLPHLNANAQIIHVSSVSARLPPVPMWAAYQASKTGFDLWLHALGNELRGRLYTTSVYFPLVRTRMSAKSPQFDHAPALTPQQAAEVIAYAIQHKPTRVAPWWLRFAELAAALFEAPSHVLLRFLYRHSRSKEG